MDYKKCLLLLLVVIIPAISVQDGFNYFKALNRTPINRVVRFYGIGLPPRTFKVPMSVNNNKRALSDARVGTIDDEDDTAEKRLSSSSEEDVISLLLTHLFPYRQKIQRDNMLPYERNAKQYTEARSIYYDEE